MVPLGALMKTELLAAVCFFYACVAVAAPDDAEQHLRPEPIAREASAWGGPSFVRSDRAGNVFLFRTDKPGVYPVNKAGGLGEPQRLELANQSFGHVLNVALNPGGDQWLVHAEGKLRLFVEGKEKPVASVPWQPWAVGFLRSSPAVLVIPRPMPDTVLHLRDVGSAPWLLTLDNNSWNALVEHDDLPAETAWKERSRINAWITEYAAFFAPTKDGRIWMGSQYGYHVRQLSSAGRVLTDISFESADRVEKKPKANPEVQAAIQQAEKQGARVTSMPFTAQQVIADLTVGPGQVLFLLVSPKGGGSLAIDRYDPGRAILERVDLTLSSSGRFTLAVGKDALYLANTREGHWRISWEALENANWKEVDGLVARSSRKDSRP
jgi:hypothetical protein